MVVRRLELIDRLKLTVKDRSTIKVGAIVEVEVNEVVNIPLNYSEVRTRWGQFYLRKSIAKKGVIQVVHTPFAEGYSGKPLIVLKNDHVADIELLAGEEIGEVWFFNL